ncbi:hypothetical protein [Desulfovibrio sp. JC022]|uniref:hypothetical protein n=1 Tax=Desulfovibrio sp. JC022 TaxID=2593642 RepID=UPI0013CFBAEC|nr:hypothetical protein [Desulfovibrio sp. JC022]NDV22068.1 hypothetical protein [Desulfovibrio sp. JC022]
MLRQLELTVDEQEYILGLLQYKLKILRREYGQMKKTAERDLLKKQKGDYPSSLISQEEVIKTVETIVTKLS